MRRRAKKDKIRKKTMLIGSGLLEEGATGQDPSFTQSGSNQMPLVNDSRDLVNLAWFVFILSPE